MNFSDSDDSDKANAAIVELSEPRRAIAAASHIVIEKFFKRIQVMCVYNNVWQLIPMFCDSVRKEVVSHSYEVTIIILNLRLKIFSHHNHTISNLFSLRTDFCINFPWDLR